MSGRNRPLDGLRGIAILLVLLQHMVVERSSPPSVSLRYLLERISSNGRTGVDLFFVLSGFLLAGILIDHGRSPGALIVFYVRRACRILPLYLAFLAAALTLCWANFRFHWHIGIGNQLPVWTYLTFTQNLAMVARNTWANPAFTPLWSLGAEEQFYLLLPILVLSFRRRSVCIIAVGLMTIAVAFRFRWPGSLVGEVCLPWRADGLMVGVIAALLVRDKEITERIQRRRAWLVALAFVLASGWLSFAFRANRFGPFTMTWVAVFFGDLVLLVVTSREHNIIGRILGSRLLVWIGTVSYGVYILHRLILILVFWAVFREPPSMATPPTALLTLAGVLLTFFIAEISYTRFERPIIAFGHRLRYGSAGTEHPIGGAPVVTTT